MSINIFAANELFWRAFQRDLVTDGMAVIRSVQLPNSFQPPMSDVIFLQAVEGIEIYLDARVHYMGNSAIWQQIQKQPAVAGPARLIVVADHDAPAAFRLLRLLLMDAGGALVADVEGVPIDVSRFEANLEDLGQFAESSGSNDAPVSDTSNAEEAH